MRKLNEYLTITPFRFLKSENENKILYKTSSNKNIEFV